MGVRGLNILANALGTVPAICLPLRNVSGQVQGRFMALEAVLAKRCEEKGLLAAVGVKILPEDSAPFCNWRG